MICGVGPRTSRSACWLHDTDVLGKFVLRKVTKKRDGANYEANMPFQSGPLAKEPPKAHGGHRQARK